ncbi:hypothetical protein JCM14713_29800 [Desulfomicrobium salsuginis]
MVRTSGGGTAENIVLRFECEGSGEANDAWISQTVGAPGPKRPGPLWLALRADEMFSHCAVVGMDDKIDRT